jgi:hypothetical protein
LTQLQFAEVGAGTAAAGATAGVDAGGVEAGAAAADGVAGIAVFSAAWPAVVNVGLRCSTGAMFVHAISHALNVTQQKNRRLMGHPLLK